jgi:hypothetical protein
MLAFCLLPKIVEAGIILKPVFQAGLVGYWDFQEGAGNNVYDKSGQGNTGTWNGTGSHWANGKIGAGGSFNGSDDYVNPGDGSSLNFASGQGFTFSAWVKTSDSRGQVVSFRDSVSGSPLIDLSIGFNGVGDQEGHFLPIMRYDGGAGAAYFLSTVNIADNAWHFVAFVYNPSTQKIYAYVDNSSWNEPQTVTGTITTAVDRAIGAERKWVRDAFQNVNYQYLSGLIDEVRIYNRALSESEVSRLYKSGATKIGAVKPVIEDNPSNAFISYVRQNCAGYSPCYNSLSDWEANYGGIDFSGCTPGDLTCANVNKTAVAKIDGPWTVADTTNVTIDGWTTDATRYIKIYTTAAARHNGKWDDNKYRLVSSSGSVIDINEDYVRIDGIQVKTTSTGVVWGLFDMGTTLTVSANEIRIQNVLGVGNSSATDSQFGCYCGTNVNLNIFNSIFYGFPNVGISAIICSDSATTLIRAYNVTGIGSVYGFWEWAGAGEIICKNCYSGESLNGDYTNIISEDKIMSASSDSWSGSTGLQNIAVDANNFKNITSGSEDFHIPPGSALKDAGTNTSGDAAPMNFTTDIDRLNRAGNWDIGADESIVAQVNSPQNNKLTDGLVGLWSFNGQDMSGDTAIDRSGQGNNGTLTYGPTRAIGKVGQALRFDGSDDYVDAGSASSLDDIETTGSGFTTSAWIYATDYGEGGQGVIVEKGNGNGSGFWIIMLDGNDPSIRFIKHYDETRLQARVSYPVSYLNTWKHIVVTWDGSSSASNVHTYIDGVERAPWSPTDGVGNKVSDADNNLEIGSTTNAPISNTFQGIIDEVRIYNRALSANEILRLYNMGR